MPELFFDRVLDYSTSIGTGTFTVDNTPPLRYRTLDAVLVNTNTFVGIIQHLGSGEWELGVYTYTGSHQFTRGGTIIAGSNGTSAVDFSQGVKEVTLVAPARSVTDAQLLTTRGDLFTRGASAIQRLGIGNSLQFLGSDGTDVAWQTPVGKRLAASSFVAVSSLDILLTAHTAYREIMIKLTGVTTSAPNRLFLRTSSNGGSSFDAGASDYAWTEYYSRDTLSTMTVEGDSDDSEIDIGFNSTATGDHISADITISGQTSVLFTHVRSVADISSSGEIYALRSSGCRQSNADVDAIRILTSTGTITGAYAVFGRT